MTEYVSLAKEEIRKICEGNGYPETWNHVKTYALISIAESLRTIADKQIVEQKEAKQP